MEVLQIDWKIETESPPNCRDLPFGGFWIDQHFARIADHEDREKDAHRHCQE